MNTLDSLFLAAEVLHANYTVADHLINAGLHYGPGILLTAGLTVAWRTWQRARGWHHDRADRRHYTAVAFRLNRVADQADTVLDQCEEELLEQLEALYNAPAHASKEDR
ncbi:hypothetical protein PV405_29935 [Streptomyces sp. ME02-6979-3A]|uniref:hypothetical protein n=1 Tax=Streptomyces sp. ME02-6979-3A TaxID=3028673 RepID=UPI0029AA3D5B|nr:hypothetical protein [Streptomyces sp. ME02-6979-3A]MDX3328833.1 hypothetical protein [Streptomyces sp. ME02-6979-3A]